MRLNALFMALNEAKPYEFEEAMVERAYILAERVLQSYRSGQPEYFLIIGGSRKDKETGLPYDFANSEAETKGLVIKLLTDPEGPFARYGYIFDMEELGNIIKTETEVRIFLTERTGENYANDSITTNKNLDVVLDVVSMTPEIDSLTLISSPGHLGRIKFLLMRRILGENNWDIPLDPRTRRFADVQVNYLGTSYLADNHIRNFKTYIKENIIETGAHILAGLGLYDRMENRVTNTRDSEHTKNTEGMINRFTD